jgi:cytochrome c oxidase subunit 2
MSTAILGNFGNKAMRLLAVFMLALAALLLARPLMAQPAAAPAAAQVGVAAPVAATPDAAATTAAAPAAGEGGYRPMAPTPGIGMPVDGGFDVQPQFSPTGRFAYGFHIAMFWVMLAISVFVLILLLFTMFKFRASANPVPSRTTHNTLLEVAWTLVPVLVLVAIAIPSISLLSQQYRTPPKNAVTIKATGYQWYWGYTYPDNGGFEVISNMLPEADEAKPGERVRTDADGPAHLAADNRMVVPVGVPLRIQTTGADVIHSFAVPSLWFKLDAVPGRLNERVLKIEKPGVYFGQCSELCGARHGYMPIVLEAVPMAQFRAWVRQQGGTFGDDKAAPAPAPSQQPASATEGAPAAGQAPGAQQTGTSPVDPVSPTPAA